MVGAGQSFAAPAPEPSPGGSLQTSFVDLTKDGAARPAAAALPAQAGNVDPNSGVAFVDLTQDASAVAMPERPLPRSRTPRTRLVDLTNGAAIPDANEADYEMDIVVPDTVVITADRLSDPYEESNRGRFKSHVWLHRNIIDPVERGYIAVVPTPARDGLHNFLFNLETPSVLANDLLQADFSRAGDTLARFLVNTTLGLAGIIDVAGRTGMHYRDNDFGATLANYGVGDGPYLLVPIIGPSNPRDLGGKSTLR